MKPCQNKECIYYPNKTCNPDLCKPYQPQTKGIITEEQADFLAELVLKKFDLTMKGWMPDAITNKWKDAGLIIQEETALSKAENLFRDMGAESNPNIKYERVENLYNLLLQAIKELKEK